jgi:hypothetical protein
MRVLWYLPANLIKGVLYEDVMVPSPFMRFAGRYYNILIKYSLYEVCWKIL